MRTVAQTWIDIL